MECMTILGVPAFDCFCTIPIVFTVILASLLAMGKLLKG